MLKTLTTIFCLLIISLGSFATIVPAGTITTNTTWTKAGSPYIITGDVTFDTNTTLTVQPGTIIRFDNTYTIWIEGKLKMQGTPTDTIIITSNLTSPKLADYQGIYIGYHNHHKDTSYIAYCRFSFASRAITSIPPVKVTNSTFNKCGSGVVGIAIVDSCLFTNCSGGAGGDSLFSITNSTFIHCSYGVSGGSNINSYCTNNIFQYNGTGVRACGNVINNIFIGNDVRAIETCVNVHYNHIWFNKVGIDFWWNSNGYLSATHNSIAYNDVGIDFRLTTGPLPNIKYNCIANNQTWDFKHSGPDIDVTNNYWGTTDSVKVDSNIQDKFDYPISSGLGRLIFVPFLYLPDSACDTIPVPTHINSTNKKTLNVAVYPNPIYSSFTIDAGAQTMQEVFIYNMTGSLVFHTTTGKNKLEINISSFPIGMYLYKVRLSDESIVTGKVLKE